MKIGVENRPFHYHKAEIDVNTFLEKHFSKTPTMTVAEAFYVGNIINYVCRFKEKNGVEDLKKAATYLIDLIQMQEGFNNDEI